jgi:hypothetical protein
MRANKKINRIAPGVALFFRGKLKYLYPIPSIYSAALFSYHVWPEKEIAMFRLIRGCRSVFIGMTVLAFLMPIPHQALAALIDTQASKTEHDPDQFRTRLTILFAREDIRVALIQHGINPNCVLLGHISTGNYPKLKKKILIALRQISAFKVKFSMAVDKEPLREKKTPPSLN